MVFACFCPCSSVRPGPAFQDGRGPLPVSELEKEFEAQAFEHERSSRQAAWKVPFNLQQVGHSSKLATVST